MIDPFPSPYVSDWEANPHIASFTVFNNTGTASDVVLRFAIVGGGGQVLASGTSDSQLLPTGASVFDSPFDLSGSFDYDVTVQNGIVRTGRLPEGDYDACTAVTTGSGFVLAEACERFSVVYPDPPMLLAPMDGETVTTPDPFFEWTPLQVPLDYPVTFALQIVEILPGQTPAHALGSNIAQFQEGRLAATSLQYPLGALPFERGHRYAWRVQALDDNGYPASAHDGSSEIWTFEYSDIADGVASVRVSPSGTRFTAAGDTARLVAQAYDGNDHELPDGGFAWTSTDTTIATVDSAGVVTSRRDGRAQIVATLDGVADTVTVSTGGEATLALRFYDPDAESPGLYELIESESFDEIVDQLTEMLANGAFTLPLPGLPGQAGDAGDGGAPGGGRSGGPAVCSSLTLPYYTALDRDRKMFAIGVRSPAEVGGSILGCLGAPEIWPNRPGQQLESLLLIGKPEGQPPQVSFGVKIPLVGLFANAVPLHWEYAVLVFNPFRGFELKPDQLPQEVEAFYPHEFEVKGLDVERELEGGKLETKTTGMGALTLYGRLNMEGTQVWRLMDVLGFEEPVVEVLADMSVGRDGGLLKQFRPDSAMLAGTQRTYVVRGTLPKRRPLIPAVASFVESMQLGIELEVESDNDTTKTTPKLVHTIELDIPVNGFPPLELEASLAWSDIAADSHSTEWVVEYEVASGGDETLVVWDHLRLKLGAEVTYIPSTTRSAAEWEFELSGTGGFESAPELLTASVGYGRQSANCGGENEPPCPATTDSTMGSLQPSPLTKEQREGKWSFKLENKGPLLAAGGDFWQLVRAIWQSRAGTP